MLQTPFYDPEKSYEENYASGPFGAFADGSAIAREGEPTVELLGEKIFLPFGIPAGPIINSQYCAAAFAKGYDLVVYKTVRTKERPCHSFPNIVPLAITGDLTPEKVAAGPLVCTKAYNEPLSITNSFGVPSQPVEIWQADMKRAVEAAGNGQVLIGSFQGTKKEGGSVENFISDYALAAKLVKETGAKILEANLSCPNEGTGNLVCFDVDTVSKIVYAIKKEIQDIPLLLKLAYFESDGLLQDLIEQVGGLVQGLAAINTIAAKIVDEVGTQVLPGEGRMVSGVCGAGIKWAGLEMVRKLARVRDDLGLDYVIIGVGGVMNPADYLQYQIAGADAIMSATGAMWHPNLAQEIWHQEKGKS